MNKYNKTRISLYYIQVCKEGYIVGMWTLDRFEPVWSAGTSYVKTTKTTEYTTTKGSEVVEEKDRRGVTSTCNGEQDRQR